MLILLADCDERHPRRCALPSVSQGIIAEMVGTTRSRVNASMGKFKKLGFIDEAGGVLLVTPALLRVVHDGHDGVLTHATSLPQAAALRKGPGRPAVDALGAWPDRSSGKRTLESRTWSRRSTMCSAAR